jgi:tuberous sclerosis protein 2
MSPQQDGDSPHRSRPRSSTTSFSPFWTRRGRSEAPPPSPPAQPLPLEALIEALTPPSVPSLSHARSLADILVTYSPIPPLSILIPVLHNLCNSEAPVSLRAAGFDILSAYWENNEAASLSTADRVKYFSLFLGSSTEWSQDLWEHRFRALRSMTKFGIETIGVEIAFLNVLKTWIQEAFEGLLSGDSIVDQSQRTERERTVEVLATFLTSVTETPEILARLPESDLSGVLHFYAGLVDQSMRGSSNADTQDTSLPSSPHESSPSNATTPMRPHTHRRHTSSLSISSMAQPTSPPASTQKHPSDLAVSVYLSHLTSQIKTLSPTYLDVILPLLFRSLAFHATPLPRLSITLPPRNMMHVEHKITDMLDSLLSGPYSAACMVILKQHLFPNLPNSIQTSIGAHRTLRNYIRRGLCTRLARAYISRESNIHYAPSGAPSRMDMERDLMERAWPKDDASLWDASKLGRVLCKSVEAWVGFYLDMDTDGVLSSHTITGKEKILEEAAGTLKDVLQEIDSRDEDGNMDDEEASAVGETLYQLASFVIPLKYVFLSDFSLSILTLLHKKP